MKPAGASLFSPELRSGRLTFLRPGNMAAHIILALIGALFLFKYSARVSEFPALIAAGYLIVYGFLAHLLWYREGLASPRAGGSLAIVVSFAVLATGFIIVTTVPEASRVGRLPALLEVIERFQRGEFPWSSAAMTRPSGLPGLFVFALPFYYAHNLGLLEVAGLMMFVVSLFMYHRNRMNVGSCLLTLLALPTMYYELIVRSELFFNMALLVLVIVAAERYLDATRFNKRFVVFAILSGVCLCTRLVVILPFVAYCAYRFRQDLVHGLLFGAISGVTFIVGIIPFLVWDAESFLHYGPFSIQMSYLPPWIAGIFLFLAFFLGWTSDSLRTWFLSVGILLFVLVLASFLLAAGFQNYGRVVLDDGFDISYMIFSIPFLLMSLARAVPQTLARSFSGSHVPEGKFY